MKPESRDRQALVKAMRTAGLDPEPIENAVGVGTPDVNWTCGWIEMKHLDCWPERASTPVRVPCFTQAQRNWITSRCMARGIVHVLLRVRREWLLFGGMYAATRLGSATQAELRDRCLVATSSVAQLVAVLVADAAKEILEDSA